MAEQEQLGSDGLVARDSGVWAKEKLYYLEHYLDIFSVGMNKKWAGKLYYVDLFAGPGKCRIRETERRNRWFTPDRSQIQFCEVLLC